MNSETGTAPGIVYSHSTVINSANYLFGTKIFNKPADFSLDKAISFCLSHSFFIIAIVYLSST